MVLGYSQVLDVRLELLQQNEGQSYHRFRLDVLYVLSVFTTSVNKLFLHLVDIEIHITLSVKNFGVILNITLYEFCQQQGTSAVAGARVLNFGKKLLILFLLLLKMNLCKLQLLLVLHNPLVEIVEEILFVSLRHCLADLNFLLLF